MNPNPSHQAPEDKKKRRKILFWWFFGAAVILSLGTVSALAFIPSEDPAPVVRIAENDVTLEEGASQFLNITVRDVDGELIYESLDASVVRFEAGTLIAVAPGITTVRVINADRTAFDEINVTVRARPDTSFTVSIGERVLTFAGPVDVNELSIDVPEGQTFEGFFLDADFENPLEASVIDASVVLYPKFERIVPSVDVTIQNLAGETLQVISAPEGSRLEDLEVTASDLAFISCSNVTSVWTH